jgi:putative sigma-54 modulation protein
MNLTYRARNTTIDNEFKEAAEARLAKLERWLHGIDSTAVVVTHEATRTAAHQYSVEVTVHSGGLILRADERGPDARAALDVAGDALARQAQRHRERLNARHRKGRDKAADAEVTAAAPGGRPAASDASADEYIAGKVVRVKQFEAKPMSQEEALAQMDLLDHDFFLFLDAASGQYAVVYKRKDGNYGLLAPTRL